MVKHKNQPKKGAKAGYAASIEPPVNDNTETDSSVSEPPPVVAKKSNMLLTKKAANNKSTSKVVLPARTTKSGAKVLKSIRKLQHTTNLLIPRAPFLRIVRELIEDRAGGRVNMRITEMAIEALREAAECLLTSIFEDSYLLALHAKRVTLFPRDMALLLNLRRDYLSHTVSG